MQTGILTRERKKRATEREKKTGERRREPKKREGKRKAEGTREGVKRKRAGKARGGGGGGDDDHRRRDGKGERRDRRDDHRREEGRHHCAKNGRRECTRSYLNRSAEEGESAEAERSIYGMSQDESQNEYILVGKVVGIYGCASGLKHFTS